MWSYFLLGAGFAFAAAVQPGPFQTFLIAETLHRGWRRTVPAALAPLLSDAPIIAAAVLVLTQIPGEMVRYLHFAGALFLFYLTRDAWLGWRREVPADETGGTADQRTIFKAALVNFLNPNPWLAWSLVLGPLFLRGYREHPAQGIALLVGFYLTMIVSLVGLISVFAFARRLGPQVRRITLGLSVLALAGFGFYQLWLGWRGGA